MSPKQQKLEEEQAAEQFLNDENTEGFDNTDNEVITEWQNFLQDTK